MTCTWISHVEASEGTVCGEVDEVAVGVSGEVLVECWIRHTSGLSPEMRKIVWSQGDIEDTCDSDQAGSQAHHVEKRENSYNLEHATQIRHKIHTRRIWM